MKFSTSALMAVALVASPLARAYECGLNPPVTSVQGGINGFGFCPDPADPRLQGKNLAIEGTHLPLSNLFDNTKIPSISGIPTGCSIGEEYPYDQSLSEDVTITHDINLSEFSPETGCMMAEVCTTVYTWAQGQFGLTTVTVEGTEFTLTDGDHQDGQTTISPSNAASEAVTSVAVTTQKDTKCIRRGEMGFDASLFGDGVELHIDVAANDPTGIDLWAIDYSQVDVYFECPCSETAPDPHFKTFSGDWFDFHGGCDLVLIDVPDYANQAGLAVNIRTTVRYAYSFIETIAIKVGEDILQVSGWGDYMINGISNVDMSEATLNGRAVTREVKSDKQFKFVVNLENGHHFTIKVYKDMISTSFDLPQEHDVRGILGDRSGTKLARDGITVIEDANEFGQEWQVQDTDHQLFVTVREPQFPAQCIMPDPVEREQRRLSATVSTEAAEAACSHVQDEHVRDMCIFDVMSVDDLSLAAGAY